MKKIVLLLLIFISVVKYSHAQNVDWNLVEQHYFEKYQPTDTPAWIFPIIAINGDGQQDTIYYCYKSYATEFLEPQFGEIRTFLDTNKFNLGFDVLIDSIRKVFISGIVSGNDNICFTGVGVLNGKYPLTIKWNGSKLYDTLLPFPNILPKPIARIGGFWAHYYTPFILGTAETFIIADTAGIGSICLDPVVKLIRDSITFDGPINSSPENNLGITLSLKKQSDGCIIGSVQNHSASKLILIEHLNNDKLTITSTQPGNTDIRIFDFYGSTITSSALHPFQSLTINVNQSTNLLIIQAQTSTALQTIKFIKP